VLDELTQEILGELGASKEARPEVVAILEAEISLLRARYLQTVLLEQIQGAVRDASSREDVAALLEQFRRVDRYVRRAHSRRKFAIRSLSCMLSGHFACPPVEIDHTLLR
jgi:hypothetical protein